MTITVKNVSLKELLDAVRRRGIKRVLLTDYATVKPKRIGSSLILVGMIEVVATALDRPNMAIYRFSEQGESEQMVTITAGTGRGQNSGGRLAARKEEIFDLLREEGLEVDEGEWKPASAKAFLASRKSMVG